MFPETEIIAKQTQDTESELTQRWSESRKLDSGYSQNDPFKQLQLEMREYPRIVPTQTTTRARSFGYIFKISFSEIVTIHQIFQQKMSTQTELETAATRDYRQLPSPKLKVQECLKERPLQQLPGLPALPRRPTTSNASRHTIPEVPTSKFYLWIEMANSRCGINWMEDTPKRERERPTISRKIAQSLNLIWERPTSGREQREAKGGSNSNKRSNAEAEAGL